jgi:hypothetical protein
MTTPAAEDPQPRDIALELETPELAAELEAQSEPDGGQQSEASSPGPGVLPGHER